MIMKNQIVAQNIYVHYGSYQVLRGITFSIEGGEFISIVGKSGSGKSTLLHALAGFIEAEGEKHVPDNVGVVFQNYAVYPWLTVAENVEVGIHSIDRYQKNQIVTKYINLVGLADHADKYPAQLSGGQTQRVALARALACNPQVIFFDEPFGALDAFTRDKMQAWLMELWEKENKTVIFVTHNIDEAIFLSDRVLVLGNGLLLEDFRVDFDRPRDESIKFIGKFYSLKKQILNTIEVT